MKLKDPSVKIPNEYTCPITCEIMNDPVSTADGHTYEREAITTWFAINGTSPVTNKVLPNKLLTPNWSLKSCIESFIKKANEDYDRKLEQQRAPQAPSFSAFLAEQNSVLETARLRKELKIAREKTQAMKTQVKTLNKEKNELKKDLETIHRSEANNADLESKLEVVETLLKKDPHSIKLLNKKAVLLRDLNRYEEALKLINYGVNKEKDNIYLLNTRASIFRETGNNRMAKSDYEHILRLDPQNYYAKKALSSVSENHVNEHRDRRSEASSASEVGNESGIHALLHSIKQLKIEKKYEDALVLANTAKRLEPHNVVCLTHYADILSKLHRYDEAIRIFDEAFDKASDNANRIYILNGKGIAYDKSGEKKKAQSSFEMTLRLDAHNAFAEEQLAKLRQAKVFTNNPQAPTIFNNRPRTQPTDLEPERNPRFKPRPR